MTSADHAGAILTIDLDAIVDNYRLLRDKCKESGGDCGAVVKMDAYGLGADAVAPALWAAGCGVFFVALVDEGLALRRLLKEAEIHVLGGPLAGNEDAYREHRLIPTLNSLGDMEAWAAYCLNHGRPLPCTLHVDTGMARLGLPPGEVKILTDDPGRLAALSLRYLISHLACAEQPDHRLNGEQLASFLAVRAAIAPHTPASLANSSGIFLGREFHFDLSRPGAALYGLGPVPGTPNPMAQVVRLQGKILQVRDVDSSQTVGYGATHRFAGPARIATVAVGYADGYLRSLSNSGSAFVGDIRVPVVGRVSMDLITLDVTRVTDNRIRPGATVDLIGPHNPIDVIADAAGTIGYEILTSLGRRYHRVYTGGGAS